MIEQMGPEKAKEPTWWDRLCGHIHDYGFIYMLVVGILLVVGHQVFKTKEPETEPVWATITKEVTAKQAARTLEEFSVPNVPIRYGVQIGALMMDEQDKSLQANQMKVCLTEGEVKTCHVLASGERRTFEGWVGDVGYKLSANNYPDADYLLNLWMKVPPEDSNISWYARRSLHPASATGIKIDRLGLITIIRGGSPT